MERGKLLIGTSEYYEKVENLDPNVRDFIGYFEAPGVALVRWVEEGVAPETLIRASSSHTSTGPWKTLNICQYPLANAFLGGDLDPDDAASYECKPSF